MTFGRNVFDAVWQNGIQLPYELTLQISRTTTLLKMFFGENKNKYTSFEEDRGKVIGDFQQYQEELWINSLKSKHKLTINKRTVKRLKKEYN